MTYPTLCTGEVRHCGLCRHPTVTVMTEDGPERRLYTCPKCEAVEVITKGGGKAWWYHGCVRPDGLRRDGDGNLVTGAKFGWWLR
jgi:hypothetical protein